MSLKKSVKILFITCLLLVVSFLVYSKFLKKEIKDVSIENSKEEEEVYESNIIKDVNFITRDGDGNEYIIKAIQGEIDFENNNVLYLTRVNGLIKLNNSNLIKITSEYGKYNTENYDTIFSKNVLIEYLDNKITSDYLDFSLNRNTMIISKDVVYTNIDNILKADVIEISLKTKDTKIFMHENEKKVSIESKN